MGELVLLQRSEYYLARGFPRCLADSPCERNSDNELDQIAGVPEIGPNKFCEQLYTYIKQISIFSLYSDFSLYSLRPSPCQKDR
jgi:hypothetical protein